MFDLFSKQHSFGITKILVARCFVTKLSFPNPVKAVFILQYMSRGYLFSFLFSSKHLVLVGGKGINEIAFLFPSSRHEYVLKVRNITADAGQN